MKRMIATVALGAIAALATLSPAAAETIELKLSHFLPPVHGMHKDFIEPWARELEKRSGGTVKVTIFPGGTQFGNAAAARPKRNPLGPGPFFAMTASNALTVWHHTLCGAFLVMAKNASGRMVPYDQTVL